MVNKEHFKEDSILFFIRGNNKFIGTKCPECGGIADHHLGYCCNKIAEYNDKLELTCVECDHNIDICLNIE